MISDWRSSGRIVPGIHTRPGTIFDSPKVQSLDFEWHLDFNASSYPALTTKYASDSIPHLPWIDDWFYELDVSEVSGFYGPGTYFESAIPGIHTRQ
jgi:hypothetical protein